VIFREKRLAVTDGHFLLNRAYRESVTEKEEEGGEGDSSEDEDFNQFERSLANNARRGAESPNKNKNKDLSVTDTEFFETGFQDSPFQSNLLHTLNLGDVNLNAENRKRQKEQRERSLSERKIHHKPQRTRSKSHRTVQGAKGEKLKEYLAARKRLTEDHVITNTNDQLQANLKQGKVTLVESAPQIVTNINWGRGDLSTMTRGMEFESHAKNKTEGQRNLKEGQLTLLRLKAYEDARGVMNEGLGGMENDLLWGGGLVPKAPAKRKGSVVDTGRVKSRGVGGGGGGGRGGGGWRKGERG